MSRQNSPSKKDRQYRESNKRTDNPSGKGPTIQTEKGPTNYLPGTGTEMMGVIGEGDLKSLLHRHHQGKWATPKRICGLLLLLDFIIRKGGKKLKISQELSHEYVRRLKGQPGTTEQPLTLLLQIGILEMAEKARVGPHLKVAAAYRFHLKYRHRFKLAICIFPQQLAKRENAGPRNEKRLNRKHPFRARLIEDMERLSLSPKGNRKALSLIVAKEKEGCTRILIESLEGKRDKKVKVANSGTITTFINNTPNDLKPDLEIDGKPVAKCDIEGAHFCVLLRIVRNRIDYYKKLQQAGFKIEMLENKIEMLENEYKKFSEMIDAEDIYSQGKPDLTKGERKKSKRAMISTLSMQKTIAVHLPEYRWLRNKFPHTFKIVEDINRSDHRNLSVQLRNYTARIINGALLELQARGIPALPDTDALIVPKEHEQLAKETVKRFLREVAGAGKVSVT